MPRPVFSLWMGDRPSVLHEASMRSFVRLGHPYTLYSYDELQSLPEGVRLADANAVLARRKVSYLLERRAYSLASNLFRYTRLLHHGGLWVDSDLIALRELDFPDEELVFGWQDGKAINVAVLGAPPNHPLIADLARTARSLRLWYPWAEPEPTFRERLERVRGTLRNGRTFALADAPWGVAGPTLATALARRHGLGETAHAPEAFYPIPWQEVELLLDPQSEAEHLITGGTYTVHAWDSILTRRGIHAPPEGSLLARLVTPLAA